MPRCSIRSGMALLTTTCRSAVPSPTPRPTSSTAIVSRCRQASSERSSSAARRWPEAMSITRSCRGASAGSVQRTGRSATMHTGDLARVRDDGGSSRRASGSLAGARLPSRARRDRSGASEPSVGPGISRILPSIRRTDQRRWRVVAWNGSADTRGRVDAPPALAPSFMVPAVVWVDAIPMTPSGKRDRTRLIELLDAARRRRRADAPRFAAHDCRPVLLRPRPRDGGAGR